jgi:hypothetical protein
MKSGIANILSCLALLLFLANYPLAEYLYPQNIQYDSNISFRFNEYAIIIMFTLLAAKNTQSRFSGFMLSMLIGLSVSDVVDRLWFNITDFRWNDLLMILATIYFSYKDNYVRNRSTNTK